MSPRAAQQKDKTLDTPKDPKPRKTGPRKKVVIEIDATDLPQDLVDAYINRPRPCPALWRARALKASQAASAKHKAHLQARAAALEAIHGESKVYDRNGGTGAWILEASTFWVTLWDLRERLKISHGLATQNVDRLWRAGLLEKQLNPARAANRKRAVGAAACEFVYRRI